LKHLKKTYGIKMANLMSSLHENFPGKKKREREREEKKGKSV